MDTPITIVTTPVDIGTFLDRNLDKLGLRMQGVSYVEGHSSVFYVQDPFTDKKSEEENRRYFTVSQKEGRIYVTLRHPEPTADHGWVLPFVKAHLAETKKRGGKIEGIVINFKYATKPWSSPLTR